MSIRALLLGVYYVFYRSHANRWNRIGGDQESVCEPRTQTGRRHRVADSESRKQAIRIRVLVWSPLVRGYACDRNHMTCCVIEDRWIYIVIFIKKVTLF
jgi:hypothetical protein